MQRARIYGICLERLSVLIGKAKARLTGEGHWARVILESYHTGDIDDIVYILELDDIEERTQRGLRKEIDYLTSTLSEASGEMLSFDYCEAGYLGLYLTVGDGTACVEEFACVSG